MKNVFLLFLHCFVFNLAATAQIEEKAPKMFQLEDLWIGSAGYIQNHSYTSLQDFQKLAPGSNILAQDFSTFQNDRFHTSSAGGGFSGMVGFTKYDNDKKSHRTDRIYRMGIQGMGLETASQSFYKKTNVPLDTLYSNITSETYYIDSVYRRNIYMSQNVTVVAVDLSVIFRTKPDKRLKLYGGFGLSIGGRFNATTTISDNESYSIETNSDNGNYESGDYNRENDQVQETYRNKGSVYAAVYLPLGYTFRLGNKRDFWKRLHLMGEIRPQLSVAGIPEIRSELGTSITSVGGFRYILSGY